MNNQRIVGLDIVRSVAILLVLFAHTSDFLLSPKQALFYTYLAGFFGVEIFFVLSGFLIGSILLKINEEHEILSFQVMKDFWVRRWFRTLPNYYLMLIVYTLLTWVGYHIFIFNDWKYFSYFLFLQSAFTKHPVFFSIAWSLTIEEWFYLLFPASLLVSSLFIKKRSTRILIPIISFIILFTAIRFLIYEPTINWDQEIRKVTFLRLDAIVIGVFAAYISYYQVTFWKKVENIGLWAGTIGLVLCIYYFTFAYHNEKSVNLFYTTLFFTIVSSCIALLLPYFSSIQQARSKTINSIFITISITSYSVYLIHPIIIKTIEKLPINTFLSFVFSWLLTFLIAYFQYYYFERKMTSLRDHFTKKA